MHGDPNTCCQTVRAAPDARRRSTLPPWIKTQQSGTESGIHSRSVPKRVDKLALQALASAAWQALMQRHRSFFHEPRSYLERATRGAAKR